MSTFSMNGSPTCTAGRLLGFASSNVSLASTDTPPMPSPPVRAPKSTTRLPAPDACASLMPGSLACRITPTHSAFTNGLPAYDGSNTTSPPMFGRPRQFP